MAMLMVTPSELRKKAGELREQNGQFKSSVGELETLEGRVMSMWESESARAFHTAFHNDKSQMDAFYTLIENYCITLENIATEYEKAENRAIETASKKSH